MITGSIFASVTDSRAGAASDVLDLRDRPWHVLADLGFDREDYGGGELDHELF